MEAETHQVAIKERLHSLDALRGFDMFWITGGSAVAVYLGQLTGVEWSVDSDGTSCMERHSIL